MHKIVKYDLIACVTALIVDKNHNKMTRTAEIEKRIAELAQDKKAYSSIEVDAVFKAYLKSKGYHYLYCLRPPLHKGESEDSRLEESNILVKVIPGEKVGEKVTEKDLRSNKIATKLDDASPYEIVVSMPAMSDERENGGVDREFWSPALARQLEIIKELGLLKVGSPIQFKMPNKPSGEWHWVSSSLIVNLQADGSIEINSYMHDSSSQRRQLGDYFINLITTQFKKSYPNKKIIFNHVASGVINPPQRGGVSCGVWATEAMIGTVTAAQKDAWNRCYKGGNPIEEGEPRRWHAELIADQDLEVFKKFGHVTADVAGNGLDGEERQKRLKENFDRVNTKSKQVISLIDSKKFDTLHKVLSLVKQQDTEGTIETREVQRLYIGSIKELGDITIADLLLSKDKDGSDKVVFGIGDDLDILLLSLKEEIDRRNSEPKVAEVKGASESKVEDGEPERVELEEGDKKPIIKVALPKEVGKKAKIGKEKRRDQKSSEAPNGVIKKTKKKQGLASDIAEKEVVEVREEKKTNKKKTKDDIAVLPDDDRVEVEADVTEVAAAEAVAEASPTTSAVSEALLTKKLEVLKDERGGVIKKTKKKQGLASDIAKKEVVEVREEKKTNKKKTKDDIAVLPDDDHVEVEADVTEVAATEAVAEASPTTSAVSEALLTKKLEVLKDERGGYAQEKQSLASALEKSFKEESEADEEDKKKYKDQATLLYNQLYEESLKEKKLIRELKAAEADQKREGVLAKDAEEAKKTAESLEGQLAKIKAEKKIPDGNQIYISKQDFGGKEAIIEEEKSIKYAKYLNLAGVEVNANVFAKGADLFMANFTGSKLGSDSAPLDLTECINLSSVNFNKCSGVVKFPEGFVPKAFNFRNCPDLKVMVGDKEVTEFRAFGSSRMITKEDIYKTPSTSFIPKGATRIDISKERLR